jgi:hypothetical protein
MARGRSRTSASVSGPDFSPRKRFPPITRHHKTTGSSPMDKPQR